MSRTTIASLSTDIAALKATVDALTAIVAAGVTAPAVAAPVKAAPAKDGFVAFIHERAAAKVACDIHPTAKCNRRFSPKSTGREGHVARIV